MIVTLAVAGVFYCQKGLRERPPERLHCAIAHIARKGARGRIGARGTGWYSEWIYTGPPDTGLTEIRVPLISAANCRQGAR